MVHVVVVVVVVIVVVCYAEEAARLMFATAFTPKVSPALLLLLP